MTICQRPGDLRRGGEKQRALLVDEDGGKALGGRDGLLRGRGESCGRESGIDRLLGGAASQERGGWVVGRVVDSRGGGARAREGIASGATRGGHVGVCEPGHVLETDKGSQYWVAINSKRCGP